MSVAAGPRPKAVKQAHAPAQPYRFWPLTLGAVGVVYGTSRYRRATGAIRRGDADAISSGTGPTVAAFVLLGVVLVSTVVLLATA